MNALTKNPGNLNFLGQVGFSFKIGRSPNFNYFIQKVDFPVVTLTPAEMPNPFVKTPLPGDHLDYDDLNITFKLDENLNGYFELYDWIKALGKPENFNESKVIYTTPRYDKNAIYSDATLVILDGNMNPNISIQFYDVLPVYLSGFTLETDAKDIQFITASMKLAYRSYDYVYVNGETNNPYDLSLIHI